MATQTAYGYKGAQCYYWATCSDGSIYIRNNEKNYVHKYNSSDGRWEGTSQTVSSSGATLTGGKGNDRIYNNGASSIIIGGAGDDMIVNMGGANFVVEYITGGGNDIITGFDGSSTLSISGATNLHALNIVGTPATFLTVTNSTKSHVTADLTTEIIDASKCTKSIDITGNAAANSIVGGSKADTLDGGAGNDTLTGGGGKDLFVYTAGNDVITDYASGDKISLGGAISKSTVNGSDAVFTIDDGTLTVKNGKGKSLVFIADDAARTIIGGAQLLDDGSAKKITLASSVEVADASDRTKSIKITGNVLANKIFGGDGNDSLWGGEGTDTIFDYSSDDMLKILTTDGKAGGSFSNSAFGKGKLTLTISGGGTVIFDGVAKGDSFNINGKSYTLNGKKLV